MTPHEEFAVSSHVLNASGLKLNSRGYLAICQLMRIGKVNFVRIGQSNTAELARILNGIGLECYLDEEALRLSPSGISNYYENVMEQKIEKEIGYVLLRGSEIEPD